MTENQNDNLKHPELVAYLDGELDGKDRIDVENKLANSPEYRNELAKLQRTWDVLDALPSVKATQEFTQSTVEMVALRTAKASRGTGSKVQFFRFGSLLLVLLIPLAAFCYGYWSKKTEMAQPNRQLIQDLPIIENLSLYRSVNAELDVAEGIRFLELLAQKPSVFLSYEPDPILFQNANSPEPNVSVSHSEFTVEALGKEQMERLLLSQREFDRFAKSQPKKIENLREFHRQLNGHPNRDELKQLLTYWDSWLKNKGYYLGRDEIDRIKDSSAEDRIREIREKELEDFEERWSRARGGAPDPQDVPFIKGFAKQKIQDLSIEIIRQLDSSDNEQTRKLKEDVENAPTHHHGFAILMRARWRLPGSSGSWNTFEPYELEAFISALSEESKTKLSSLTTDLQFDVVQSWIVIAMFEIDDSDLQEFHDKGLTGKQRDSLKGMNSTEQKKAVQRAFRMALFQDITKYDDLSKLPESRRRGA